MKWFRRETLNERLQREAGLEREPEAPPAAPEQFFPLPPTIGGGAYGQARLPREWDVTVTADAPDVEGAEVVFVALPDGSLLVEDEQGDADLGPLAGAVEEQLRPPYRAHAVRRTAERWSVAAVRLEVAELPGVGEDELEATRYGGETTGSAALVVWVERQHPELTDFSARAERLDGDLWEVHVDPL